MPKTRDALEGHSPVVRWERVWPPLNQFAWLWHLDDPAWPTGRIRIYVSSKWTIHVHITSNAVFLTANHDDVRLGTLVYSRASTEIHSYLKAGEGQEESYREFTAEWMPLFRRDLWLAGFPLEATGTEKAEWMLHGRELGMKEGEFLP